MKNFAFTGGDRMSTSRRLLAVLALSLLVASGCGSSVDSNDQAGKRAVENPESQERASDSGNGTADTSPNTAWAPDAGAPQSGAESTASPALPAPGATAAPAGPKASSPAIQATPGRQAASSGQPAPAGSATKPAAGGGGAPERSTSPLPAPGQPGSPTAPKEPKGEVVLGTFGVRTGPLGALEVAIRDATSAWLATINAKGGLNGHPVRLIDADDGGDPSHALSIARRMVENDKVQAFFNTYGPTTEDAVAKYLEDKQVPLIGSSGGSTSTETSPMFFHAGPGSPTGNGWATVAPAVSVTDRRKAALWYCREVQICPTAAEAIKKFGVINVVHEAQVSLAQPDFTAEVLAARNAGANVLLAVVENATVVRMARAARRQNWDVVISTQWSGHEERLISQGGKDVEGTLAGSSTAPWDISPKMAEYRAAMKQYVPNGVEGGLGASAWVAGKMLERIGGQLPANPSSADYLNALYGLKEETFGGLLPPTTFLKGPRTPDKLPNLCVVPVQVQGGKFTAPKGEAFVCAPGWKPPTP